MQVDDHIASTLKRCCSNAMVILKIVNIHKVLKTPHQNTKYFNYSLLQVIKCNEALLETVKLFKLKKLQKFLSCLAALTPPHTHTHCPFAHNTMGYLYYNLFHGLALYLPTLRKRQVGQGNHGIPSESFCVNATVVN